MYRQKIISTDKEFRDLRNEWNELLEKSDSPSVFLSWEWQYQWWNYYKNGKSLFILTIRNEKDQLVGIAPFCLNIHRVLKLRLLTFLAADEIVCSEFLDLIVHKGKSTEVRSEIFSFLGEHKIYWDVMVLGDVQVKSGTVQFVNGICSFPYSIKHKERCPYIDLPNDFDVYLSGLHTRTRKNIRNHRKRLYHQYGVSFERLTLTDDAIKILNILFELHQKRRYRLGKSTTLGYSNFRKFYKSTMEFLKNKNLCDFFILKYKNRIFAVASFLKFNNEYYFYQGGFDNSFLPSHIGVMTVLLSHCIESAIELGMERIHFLRGDSNFKKIFTNEYINTQNLILGSNYKYYLYLGFIKADSFFKAVVKNILPVKLREFIKQNRIKNDKKKLTGR